MNHPLAMRADVEKIFRNVFAPRRVAHLCNEKQDVEWSETLDWQNNEYDFHRLLRCVCARLDSDYRRKLGFRLDQLAEPEVLIAASRHVGKWYQHAHPAYRRVRFYEHLYRELDRVVSKQTGRMFECRHKKAVYSAKVNDMHKKPSPDQR